MLPFDFGIKDVIDVFLVALMLYNIYRLMKESRSLNVFFGIMVFVVIWLFVSQILEMRLLGSIMDKLVSVGVIALIVLFQEEIRKFLYTLGAHERFKSIYKYFSSSHSKDEEAQPVREVGTNRCYVTSQNHGYAVDARTLGTDWEELFVNMNDGSNEGIRHKENPWFSSQFHPEACSGPVDTEFMFDKFVETLK